MHGPEATHGGVGLPEGSRTQASNGPAPQNFPGTHAVVMQSGSARYNVLSETGSPRHGPCTGEVVQVDRAPLARTRRMRPHSADALPAAEPFVPSINRVQSIVHHDQSQRKRAELASTNSSMQGRSIFRCFRQGEKGAHHLPPFLIQNVERGHRHSLHDGWCMLPVQAGHVGPAAAGHAGLQLGPWAPSTPPALTVGEASNAMCFLARMSTTCFGGGTVFSPTPRTNRSAQGGLGSKGWAEPGVADLPRGSSPCQGTNPLPGWACSCWGKAFGLGRKSWYIPLTPASMHGHGVRRTAAPARPRTHLAPV